MSFSDFYINDARKQHINLSQYAWSMIENDMFLFSNNMEPLKLSPFLNRIFLNYTNANYFPCNIDQKMIEQKECYQKILSTNCTIKEAKTLSALMLEKNDIPALHNQIAAYEKGTGKKIYLQTETYRKLISLPPDSYIEKVFQKPGKYLKAIFEEYSRLPYIEREKIYHFSTFTMIQDAIELQYTLYIETGDQIYEVIPYGIFPDHFHTYHYLVGLSRPQNDRNAERHICASFRIARIKSIKTNRANKKTLSTAEENALLSAIKLREVPFLLDDTVEVKVRFSPTGLIQYQNLLYLRPTLIKKIDSYTYVFQATLLQIEAYFFKFGSDVEILEPQTVRRDFKEKYQNSLAQYQK